MIEEMLTIDIQSLGETRISVEPTDCIFDAGDDAIVAVDIPNEVIIAAYEYIKQQIKDS
tara:strand:- start:184 stop:360 length:177 start_codon:yes stop_codon:yes gene_type:complete